MILDHNVLWFTDLGMACSSAGLRKVSCLIVFFLFLWLSFRNGIGQ